MDSCVSSEYAAFASASWQVTEISLALRNLLGNIPPHSLLMTYVTDPIGDLLTRLRNAQSARRAHCSAPHSRLKQELCELLKREGWLQEVAVTGEIPKRTLEVTFVPGKKLHLKRISRPGQRIYSKSIDLLPVLRGYGQAILTTSQGLMTDSEARSRNIGGEVLCTVS